MQLQPAERPLVAERFQVLADVPTELEWFANLSNASTRRAYQAALGDITRFIGIQRPDEFRSVTRAHVIAWRDDLASRGLLGQTIRHRLAALSSLFEHLCDSNAVTHNPVKGVKRPAVDSQEGRTPALGDYQARRLLDHHAYIAKVQEWLGHANIATTRIYDHRKTRGRGQPDVQGGVLAQPLCLLEGR